MKNTEIELRPFLRMRGTEKEELQRPWSVGDYTYATDAKILIRVPRRADVPTPQRYPQNADDYIAAGDGKEFFRLEVPSVGERDKNYCCRCDGRGLVEVCDICGGKGEFVDGIGSHWNCPKCEGYGEIGGDEDEGAQACQQCLGTGDEYESLNLKIGELFFDFDNVVRIFELPDLRVAIVGMSLVFRFEGGAGVVMALTEEVTKYGKVVARLVPIVEGGRGMKGTQTKAARECRTPKSALRLQRGTYGT